MIHNRFFARFYNHLSRWMVYDDFLACFHKYDTAQFDTETGCLEFIKQINYTHTTYYEAKNKDTYSSKEYYIMVKAATKFINR